MDISKEMYARMVESLTSEKLHQKNLILELESRLEVQKMVIQKLEQKVEDLEDEEDMPWKAMVERLEGDNNRQAKYIGVLEKKVKGLDEELQEYKDALDEAIERLEGEGIAVIRDKEK